MPFHRSLASAGWLRDTRSSAAAATRAPAVTWSECFFSSACGGFPRPCRPTSGWPCPPAATDAMTLLPTEALFSAITSRKRAYRSAGSSTPALIIRSNSASQLVGWSFAVIHSGFPAGADCRPSRRGRPRHNGNGRVPSCCAAIPRRTWPSPHACGFFATRPAPARKWQSA